jgi:hypothetical protein
MQEASILSALNRAVNLRRAHDEIRSYLSKGRSFLSITAQLQHNDDVLGL